MGCHSSDESAARCLTLASCIMKAWLGVCWLLVASSRAVPIRLTSDAVGLNLRRIKPLVEEQQREKSKTAQVSDPDNLGEKKLKEVHDEFNEAVTKVRDVSIADMIRQDVDDLRIQYLPGMRFHADVIMSTLLFIIASTGWLVFYFRSLYHNDRSEHMQHWGISDLDNKNVGNPRAPRRSASILEGNQSGNLVTNDVKPDVIIVFHHPTHEAHTSRKDHIKSRELKPLLVEDLPVWRVLAAGGVVRPSPSTEGQLLNLKRAGELVKGFLKDGWVALEDEPGYIAFPGEGMVQQLEHDGGGAHTEGNFHAFHSVLKETMEAEHRHQSVLQRARERLGSAFSQSTQALPEGQADNEHPTLGMARIALLRDLYTEMPKWGFDVSIFSSIDDDELYVCVSLEDEGALESYLLRYGLMLQLRQDIVEKLGIKQPPEEDTSSPPFVRYDPRIIKKLVEAGILDDADPRELFKSYHGKNPDGVIVKGSDRFEMIFRQISQHFDLDGAVGKGLLVDWYPAHSKKWLDRLEQCWGSFDLLKDLTLKQPIPLLHDYFGARVAFISAWNGFYAKALLALSLLAFIGEAVLMTMRHVYEDSSGGSAKRVVLAFSVVMMIWSRFAKNLWMREQEYFLAMWELTHDSNEPIRAKFRGEKAPSPADSNLMEKQFSANQVAARRFATNAFTLGFCGVVGTCIIFWAHVFEGSPGLFASIVLTVMIVVFQQIYNLLVGMLTDWENHKYQSTYYDSYVFKQFMFECVNRYWPFFFLAIKQRHTEAGCPDGGCLAALRAQLWMTMLLLSLTRIGEIVAASVTVQLKVFKEDYELEKQHKAKMALRAQEETDAPDTPAPKRSFAELQSKFEQNRLQEQINSMMQLVLALGFVLLFGCVAPIIVPFCFAVFVIQLRGQAYVMVKFSKRAIPRPQYGIGIWGTIVQTVMNASLVFSAFLIATYGDLFAGVPVLTKVAGMILYVAVILAVWTIIDIVYPPHSANVKTLQARRYRTKTVLLERATNYKALVKEGDDTPAGMESRPGIKAELSDLVRSEAWDEIPHVEDAPFLKQQTL